MFLLHFNLVKKIFSCHEFRRIPFNDTQISYDKVLFLYHVVICVNIRRKDVIHKHNVSYLYTIIR